MYVGTKMLVRERRQFRYATVKQNSLRGIVFEARV